MSDILPETAIKGDVLDDVGWRDRELPNILNLIRTTMKVVFLKLLFSESFI